MWLRSRHGAMSRFFLTSFTRRGKLRCSWILLNDGKKLNELWGLAGVIYQQRRTHLHLHVHVLMPLTEPDRRRALSSQRPVTLLSLPFSSLHSPLPPPLLSTCVCSMIAQTWETHSTNNRNFVAQWAVSHDSPCCLGNTYWSCWTQSDARQQERAPPPALKSPFIYFLFVYTECRCICPCVQIWGGMVSVHVCACMLGSEGNLECHFSSSAFLSLPPQGGYYKCASTPCMVFLTWVLRVELSPCPCQIDTAPP